MPITATTICSFASNSENPKFPLAPQHNSSPLHKSKKTRTAFYNPVKKPTSEMKKKTNRTRKPSIVTHSPLREATSSSRTGVCLLRSVAAAAAIYPHVRRGASLAGNASYACTRDPRARESLYNMSGQMEFSLGEWIFVFTHRYFLLALGYYARRVSLFAVCRRCVTIGFA